MKKFIEDIPIYLFLAFRPRALIKLVRDVLEAREFLESTENQINFYTEVGKEDGKKFEEEISSSVVTVEDHEKRTVTISLLSESEKLELTEWQANVLADGLTKICQDWSKS